MESSYGSYGGYNSYQNNGVEKKDFAKIASAVGSNIQKISSNVRSISKMVNSLGTSQDSPDLKQKLHHIVHYTNTLAKDTNASFKELSSIPLPQSFSDQREFKMQKERLMEEFTSALSAFQEAQRLACQKEKEEVMRNKPTYIPPPPSSDPFENSLLELQDSNYSKQMLQIEQEEQNLQLIEEQEQAIMQLEREIKDVNEIFKDLGTMIHNQGEVIDSIEAFVENAEVSVGIGHSNLKKASQHATQARKKMFILYSILAIIVLSLILLIAWKS